MLDDTDGDGFGADVDCDDHDADVYPGADDIWYDGVDSDCSGDSDYDQDADGYDASAYGGADCDDVDADINPDSAEDWYDGVDQNCDGNDDDQDGDGYPRADDCDDTDADRFPDENIEEIWYNGIDENCDGNDGDQDGDGYVEAGYAYDWTDFNAHVGDGDCWDDPADPSEEFEAINGFDALSAEDVNPEADETWYDAVDQDCDGADDFDADGDGWATMYWSDRSGAVAGEDCYDSSDDGFDNPAGLTTTAVNPSAADDWYDGTDADCDGSSDYDQDGDGHDSDGYGGDDCDDGVAGISPDATESCATSYDDDCDADTNDLGATGCSTWYADADGDTYGSTDGACLCAADATYSAVTATDCDDADSSINPAATEVCDSADTDEDCDTLADDDDSSVSSATMTTWYRDADLDGYGRSSTSKSACDRPIGYVADSTDCDDSSSGDYPGSTEVVGNGDDEDCDGAETCYDDDDNDGFLDTTADTRASTDTDCSDTYEGTNTDLTTDCDDSDSGDYPGATEVTGNGDDEDCDGTEKCYDDDDNDGYLDTTGDTRSSTDTDCSDSKEGTSSDPTTDCDDANAAVYPGATEIVGDGVDENCDSYETCYDDDDSDGYLDTAADTRLSLDTDCSDAKEGKSSDPTTDCDDADDTAYPGAAEVCEDTIVNDCTGTEADATASCALYGSDNLSTFKYLRGVTASDALGDEVAYAGDVDADGYDDFMVAATAANSSAGYVYLVNGSKVVSAGPKVGDVDVVRVAGDAASDLLGTGLGAGDVDGDGYPDLLIGAPLHKTSLTAQGAAYLITTPGATDSDASTLADSTFVGKSSSDYAGSDVDIVGDVDGDGGSDVLVGSARSDFTKSNGGVAYLMLTPVTAGTVTLSSTTADLLLTGEAASDYAGDRVSAAGDVDGDGLADMLVGAYDADYSIIPDVGKAYLILADTASAGGTLSLASADLVVRGATTNDALGTSLSSAGDLDADGYDDFVIGAPYEDDSDTDAGAAAVFLGQLKAYSSPLTFASADAMLDGVATVDCAGTSVAGAGDVNADGYADLMIGANGNDDYAVLAGAAYLMYGPVASGTTVLTSADATFLGAAVGDGAGTSVSNAGDWTGDGYDDPIIGAVGADKVVTDGGAVYLPYGTGY